MICYDSFNYLKERDETLDVLFSTEEELDGPEETVAVLASDILITIRLVGCFTNSLMETHIQRVQEMGHHSILLKSMH